MRAGNLVFLFTIIFPGPLIWLALNKYCWVNGMCVCVCVSVCVWCVMSSPTAVVEKMEALEPIPTGELKPKIALSLPVATLQSSPQIAGKAGASDSVTFYRITVFLLQSH